jgi:hypothetical protein
MQRKTDSLQADGRFTAARFQFRDPELKYLPDRAWRWDRPPFAGTKELSGLKILIMLFSNWDNKDARVGRGGPNTAEFDLHGKRIAAFTDWGSGMGRWGEVAGSNSDWNCADFTAQTPLFLPKFDQKQLFFGWKGAIFEGFATGIPPSHAVWLLNYLGKIPDAEFHNWLQLAGATDADADCFTRALRARIDQLRKAASAK